MSVNVCVGVCLLHADSLRDNIAILHTRYNYCQLNGIMLLIKLSRDN